MVAVPVRDLVADGLLRVADVATRAAHRLRPDIPERVDIAPETPAAVARSADVVAGPPEHWLRLVESGRSPWADNPFAGTRDDRSGAVVDDAWAEPAADTYPVLPDPARSGSRVPVPGTPAPPYVTVLAERAPAFGDIASRLGSNARDGSAVGTVTRMPRDADARTVDNAGTRSNTANVTSSNARPIAGTVLPNAATRPAVTVRTVPRVDVAPGPVPHVATARPSTRHEESRDGQHVVGPTPSYRETLHSTAAGSATSRSAAPGSTTPGSAAPQLATSRPAATDRMPGSDRPVEANGMTASVVPATQFATIPFESDRHASAAGASIPTAIFPIAASRPTPIATIADPGARLASRTPSIRPEPDRTVVPPARDRLTPAPSADPMPERSASSSRPAPVAPRSDVPADAFDPSRAVSWPRRTASVAMPDRAPAEAWPALPSDVDTWSERAPIREDDDMWRLGRLAAEQGGRPWNG